ncbi:MAG: DUF805 domain-containing protein [bacterium]|nr:DUF805 domain-containing protein [Candidatus Limimorpha equi]
MTFGQSVATCLSKYVSFNGRASRSEYWWFYLFNFLVGLVCGAINETLNLIVSLALLLPSLAVAVRRMHDTGRSGWCLFIPIANIVFACMKSESGANQYGDEPDE